MIQSYIIKENGKYVLKTLESDSAEDYLQRVADLGGFSGQPLVSAQTKEYNFGRVTISWFTNHGYRKTGFEARIYLVFNEKGLDHSIYVKTYPEINDLCDLLELFNKYADNSESALWELTTVLSKKLACYRNIGQLNRPRVDYFNSNYMTELDKHDFDVTRYNFLFDAYYFKRGFEENNITEKLLRLYELEAEKNALLDEIVPVLTEEYT
jgi:hypothetical protein